MPPNDPHLPIAPTELAATERELAVTRDSRNEQPGALVRGLLVGRYVVLGHLGSGGMGIVYAAYDPELDRKIALKLVTAGRDDHDGRVRLLREAQAMARLAHPNVVPVHDVGAVGDTVFIAMEFVQGVTLSRWLEARARSLGVLEATVGSRPPITCSRHRHPSVNKCPQSEQ